MVKEEEQEQEEEEEDEKEAGQYLEEAGGGGTDALPSFRPAPEAVGLRTAGAEACRPPTTQPGDNVCVSGDSVCTCNNYHL